MTKLKQQIEEMRAGATKPSCFQDILDLQKKLDKILETRQTRPRTLTDICLSAVAECIEFNEETRESHKTWKEKPFNELEMKKEAIDILFFFAQLANSAKAKVDDWEEVVYEASVYFYQNIEGIFQSRNRKCVDVKRNTVKLINLVSKIELCQAYPKELKTWGGNLIVHSFINLGRLYELLKMDSEEVHNLYWDKWNKNLDRIGEEWN